MSTPEQPPAGTPAPRTAAGLSGAHAALTPYEPGSGGPSAAQRIKDLEAVLSVTRAMAAEPDLGNLLLMLAGACSQVLRMERTSLWLVDPADGSLFTRVAEGSAPIRVPRGTGIVGAVAESGALIAIPDAYADPRFNPEIDRKSGFRTREILCVPLFSLSEDRVVGVLQALNRTGPSGTHLSTYDIELAQVLAAQTGVVLEQAALREQALERRRLQEEMNLARSIQTRLLPREQPRTAALQVAGLNRPATETSGDYFDYLKLPDGALGIVIADVTGHGLGAALVMIAARAFVRALSGTSNCPGTITGLSNDLLEKDLEGGNFLSLCLAAFSADGRELRYASAGHDPPLVYRPGEDAFAELESTGPLLGILPGASFAVGGPLPLQSGDVLLFMTDGLFECMSPAEETFGKERLKAVVKRHAGATAQELLDALLAATDEWTGGQAPRDDITVVVVKVV